MNAIHSIKQTITSIKFEFIKERFEYILVDKELQCSILMLN